MITPWEVSGEIDYQKLIREFGTSPLTPELLEELEKRAGRPLPTVLRRGFFFSHRDLKRALEKGFFIYTGRGPSGKMHLGHLPPFMLSKWLQDAFGVNVYIMLSDDEKYVHKRDLDWDEIDQYSLDNARDIAALGFDPDKTFIFRDTEYIKNMYKGVLAIARKTTFSTARAVFGFTNDTNIGLIFYPSIQIAPTFFEKKVALIPAGIDQDPYWRIQRDIAPYFGYEKIAAIHSKFFPSLKGLDAKMSSSQPDTVIWLDEDEKSLKRKIMNAFSGGQPTIEEHRRLGGKPEIDIAYLLLYYFFEEDDNKIKEIEESYRSGALLTGELKLYAYEKI
ncbi:MAG: tryptophan--tRNA ligase, partial [Candidatus Micrarchaeota archaeon]|nr:tryptophan--tRNA ligase [Candidatus Micrarchaeota archaeon]